MEADDGFVDDLYDQEELGREALATYGFNSIESKLEAKRLEKEKKEKKQRRSNWLFESVRNVLNWWLLVCFNKQAAHRKQCNRSCETHLTKNYVEDTSSLSILLFVVWKLVPVDRLLKEPFSANSEELFRSE